MQPGMGWHAGQIPAPIMFIAMQVETVGGMCGFNAGVNGAQDAINSTK